MIENIRKVSALTESQEQNAVARYLDKNGFLWAHVPNERANAVQRFRLKQAGVKPGVPDILIFSATPERFGAARGVAIELKRRTGRPRDVKPNQWNWLESLMKNGWLTYVAFGAKDAVKYIREIYDSD